MKRTLMVAAVVVALVLGIGLPAAALAQTMAIDIEKYVSLDGGTTWLDADDPATAPIATVGQDVKLMVTVTNTGDSALAFVEIIDSTGLVFIVHSELAAGVSENSNVVTVTALPGLQYDLATVKTGCADVHDADPAYYYGEECGGEGCTPGYWKNNWCKWDGVAWGPTGYSGTDNFSEVFGRTIEVRVGRQVVSDPTLFQALNAQGGGINALARHAVAALLNAASPDVDYAMSEAGVIAAVQNAIDGGDEDISALAGTLADYNEAGCPLDQHCGSCCWNRCGHSTGGGYHQSGCGSSTGGGHHFFGSYHCR